MKVRVVGYLYKILVISMVIVFLGCKTQSSQLSESLQSESQLRYICNPEVILRDDSMNFITLLYPGDVFELMGERREHNNLTYVNGVVGENSGWVAAKFLKTSTCPKVDLPMINGMQICEYTWDEKPGYADYRIKMNPRFGYGYSGDTHGRKDNQTLVDSGRQAGSSLCEKAKFLKPCFEKAVKSGSHYLIQKFLTWAKNRGIDPVKALMAISEKETKLGHLADQGANGVGLMQLITILETPHKYAAKSEWPGVTHNILTNIHHAMRVAGAKVETFKPRDLWELAHDYNGSSTRSSYASAVSKYYADLGYCSF